MESLRAFEGGERYRLPGLGAFCAALLPPEAGGPDPRELAADVERFAARLPRRARAMLRAGIASVSASSARGRPLGRLSVEERERALGRFTRVPAIAQGVDALKTLVLLVAGSQAGALELLGWTGAMPLSQPDPELDVTPAAEWPARVRCDVVVIGSGAGGAMAARTLARAGLRTVVVEEGRRFGVEEFRTGHPLERWTELYRDAGSSSTLGSPPILLPVGRGVGGTTLVNSGTCYRPPHDVLLAWRDRHGLSLADPDRLGGFVEDAWRTI